MENNPAPTAGRIGVWEADQIDNLVIRSLSKQLSGIIDGLDYPSTSIQPVVDFSARLIVSISKIFSASPGEIMLNVHPHSGISRLAFFISSAITCVDQILIKGCEGFVDLLLWFSRDAISGEVIASTEHLLKRILRPILRVIKGILLISMLLFNRAGDLVSLFFPFRESHRPSTLPLPPVALLSVREKFLAYTDLIYNTLDRVSPTSMMDIKAFLQSIVIKYAIPINIDCCGYCGSPQITLPVIVGNKTFCYTCSVIMDNKVTHDPSILHEEHGKTHFKRAT